MPSYMCGSTRISLSVADLETSTTASPMPRVGPEAGSLSQTAADELKKDVANRTLSETPIYTEEPWPSHLRFLGANQDMPFLMVHASKDIFNPNTSRRSSFGVSASSMAERSQLDRSRSLSGTSFSSLSTLESTAVIGPEDEISLLIQPDKFADTDSSQQPCQNVRSSKDTAMQHEHHMGTSDGKGPESSEWNHLTTKCNTMESEICRPLQPNLNVVSNNEGQSCPEMKPHALCLTVHLSKKSFLRRSKGKSLDLKIDIYLNGEFCSSSYVPERTCLDSNLADLTQRFAGRRIERLLERPWIIVPPRQSSDGALREHIQSKEREYDGALERWNAIADLLREEAEKGGRNVWGDLSVLGDYLNSLSKMEMPKEAGDLQRPEGPKFGIIDVVLTTGHGKKFPPNYGYLSEPIAIKTSEFMKSKEGPPHMSSVGVAELQTPKLNAKQRLKSTADAEIIAGGFTIRTSRVRDVSELQRCQGSRDLDVSDPVSVLKRKSLLPPPNTPPFTSPARRQRRSGTTRTVVKEKPAGVATTIPDEESVTDRLTTSSQLTLVMPTSSGSLTAQQSSLPAISPERPAAPSSELPTRKRRRLLAPESNTPQAPSSSHHSRARRSQQTPVDSRNRLHSPSGRFTRLSTQLTPGKPILGKPTNIPQKRYKGHDDPAALQEIAAEEAERLRRRSRMRGELVLTNKMTLAEEIAAIQEQAREEMAPAPKPNGSTDVATTACQDETSTLRSDNPRPGSQLLIPQPLSAATRDSVLDVPLTGFAILNSSTSSSRIPPTNSSPEGSSSLAPPSALPERPATTTDANSSPPSITPLAPDTSSPHEPRTLPRNRRTKSRRSAPAERPPSTWQPSALHDDCVVTYAPDKVRQIRSERSGWFREVGVLVGVRFLIG